MLKKKDGLGERRKTQSVKARGEGGAARFMPSEWTCSSVMWLREQEDQSRRGLYHLGIRSQANPIDPQNWVL